MAFLAGTLPGIRSYTVDIYDSGQPYTIDNILVLKPNPHKSI